MNNNVFQYTCYTITIRPKYYVLNVILDMKSQFTVEEEIFVYTVKLMFLPIVKKKKKLYIMILSLII